MGSVAAPLPGEEERSAPARLQEGGEGGRGQWRGRDVPEEKRVPVPVVKSKM